MTDHAIADDSRAPAWRAAFPWLVAAAVYAMLQLLGQRLLNDPDSYWHLVVGQQILATWSFPHADTYSHTMAGAPWIAKEWLSQVIYATAYALGGWTAVVAAAAAAIALAFGLLATRAARRTRRGAGVRTRHRRAGAGIAASGGAPACAGIAGDGGVRRGHGARGRSRPHALAVAAAADDALGQSAWRLHAGARADRSAGSRSGVERSARRAAAGGMAMGPLRPARADWRPASRLTGRS